MKNRDSLRKHYGAILRLGEGMFSIRGCVILLIATLAAVSAGARLARAQQIPGLEIPAELQDSRRTVTIRADSQQKIQNVYRLLGHVEITYQDLRLTADRISFNDSNGEVDAEGHVTFIDPMAHFQAEEAHYDLDTERGWFAKAHGYLHPKLAPRAGMVLNESPFYLRAERVERISENTYTIENARVSTCECDDKGWSIALKRARVEVGDKVVSHGNVFRLFKVPLFYAPVLANSISREPRKTGLLIPTMGNSTQKGYIIGEGFFWAINPSADLQVGLEEYTKRGVARMARFRARPSADSQINVDYYGVNDKATPSCQPSGTNPPPANCVRAAGQSLRAAGQAQNLFDGVRGVLDIDYVNTLAFRQTWTNNFSEAVSSEAHQTGFLTRDWSAYSANFYVSRYQNFLSTAQTPGNSIIIQQTPSVYFSGVDKRLGNSPFYFAFDSSAAGVERVEPDVPEPALSERLDLHPQLTLRSKPLWGFRLTPEIGFQFTRYGDSLHPNHNPIDRGLAQFSLDLRPPSFEKVLAHTYYGYRLKHVIEPEIRYRLVRASDKENIDDIIRYDELDILTETNEIEYSLTNTLYARKDVPDGADVPQARSIVSLRLSQKYYFDPTFGGALEPGNKVVWEPTVSLTGFAFAQGRRLSPIVSVLKIAPSSSYDTEIRADFGPNGGGVLNFGITSHVHRGPLGLAATEFLINRTETLLTIPPPQVLSSIQSFNLLRVIATYGDVNRKGFSAAAGLDYNFAQGIAHQEVGQATYNFGCFGIDFEYRRWAIGTLRQEHVFRVALSLSNVGTFGNFRSRERLSRQPL
jgi:LPS-assembly protein